ncbi:MAG TPA: alkaline phosphatase [Epsilonproteobacteria bacterium]|nr:alkaline phosphatase [Campylobacterota bacterium]
MSLLDRREFIKISALSACSLFISTTLTGCGKDEEKGNYISVGFDHGVASGDPLSDRVIIWTRATPKVEVADDQEFDIDFEVAKDADFTEIVRKEKVNTSKEKDFTVKVDVQELEAGTSYYYRFKSKELVSPVGKTKTLPVGDVSSVKMAVFTCANYPNGYFNAYTEAAKMDDLDATVHVGDYIYEYGMFESDGTTPAYATKNAQNIGRELPADNDKELLTLDDYRKRYALYHTDSGTQDIHKACPMIVVWDDHEVANDSYKDGAQNHNVGEGEYSQRVADALQAYFEWLPIRPIVDKKKIYRSFDFGNLVSLHMLETRLFGRDKQLNYADYYTPDFDATSLTEDLTAPSRTMMGAEQLTWLQGKLQDSSATWQVLGQQVLMGRMNLPAEILGPVAQLENATDAEKATLMQQINTSLSELAQIKAKKLQGGTLTAIEQQRIDTALPYNLDAWDGYFAEREAILGTAKALDKNLVVLSGDTHNAWANDLKDMHGDQVGVEFATTSVTSPGLEDYLGLPDVGSSMEFEGVLSLLIDDLKYANTFDRGFMTMEFSKDEAISEWHFVDNYHSKSYGMNDSRFARFRVKAGVEGRNIEIVNPIY